MKKLLVWDGDGTLWRGSVIEGNITLPEDRKSLCKNLRDRGVIQSIASFNLQADVDAVLHEHGLTECFVASKAAFGVSKPELIQSIMDELGLTKYSDVVFVDDEPFNRSEVSESMPGVTSIAPNQLFEAVQQYFTKLMYTEEDRNRVRMYKSAIVRKVSGLAYGEDRTAFLRSCAMRMELFQPIYSDKPRVDDLIARANRMSAKSWYGVSNELWAIKASDKFGDYGLSGVIGLDGDIIKLLVISCRLQGMGYGSAFLGSVINRFVGNNLIAEWVATEYNHGVRSLYDWYDFSVTDAEGYCTAIKRITNSVTLPDWIVIS